MGDTSETNTKVLSRELFLGVVALKRLYRKSIICAIRSLFTNSVTYNDIHLPIDPMYLKVGVLLISEYPLHVFIQENLFQ